MQCQSLNKQHQGCACPKVLSLSHKASPLPQGPAATQQPTTGSSDRKKQKTKKLRKPKVRKDTQDTEAEDEDFEMDETEPPPVNSKGVPCPWRRSENRLDSRKFR